MSVRFRKKDNPTVLVSLPSPVEYQGMRYNVPAGGRLGTEIEVALGYYLDVSPTPTTGYKLGDIPSWNEVTGTVVIDVVLIPAATSEEIAYQINQTIDSICSACDIWVNSELNAAGVMMVDRILRLEPANLKALATDNWVRAEYYEAEVRKYYVQMGIWTANFEPYDFSMRVKKPYLVSSLDLEYRRLYPAPPYLP